MTHTHQTLPDLPVTPRHPRKTVRGSANLKSNGIERTLSGLAPHFRSKVYKVYDQMGEPRYPLTLERKAALAEAIFQIEDKYEYKLGSYHPQVKALRAARNVLYDALGYNEYNQWRKAGYQWINQKWVLPSSG